MLPFRLVTLPRLRSSPGRLLGLAAVAAGAFYVGRGLVRLRRELAGLRSSEARLRSAWTTVPAPGGGETLRLHAWVHDGPPYAAPPVVLIHGYGIGAGYFIPLAARLSDNLQVYAPELPGHGQSPHAAQPLSVPQLADALADWMAAWELRFALLVGHSLGCQIAVELAARRPELAVGLVLIGPTSDAAARSVSAQLARAVRTSLFERPGLGVLAGRDFRRAGARLLGREMAHMLHHSIEAPLLAVKCPVRVLRGAEDRISPQRWVETVTRIVDCPPPTVIPGAGHAVHYDHPDAVARALLDFSKEIGDGQPVPVGARERHGMHRPTDDPLPPEQMPAAG